MTKARITKKLVAIAATMMLLAAMVIPAVAAPGTPEGVITVTKYAGASLADATANNTGEVQTVDPSYTPIAGAGFTLYQVPDASVNALIDLLVNGVTVSHHVINVPVLPALPTITWTLSNGTTHAATVTTHALGAEKITPVSGVVTFGDGTPTGSLADGYYILVETTTPPAGAGNPAFMPASPSLIRMPMTYGPGPNAGEANYDVYVYPKNISSGGIANKDIAGIDKPVSNGDVVDFELKSKFSSGSVGSAADLRLTATPTSVATDYGTAAIEEHFNLYFESTGNDTDIEVFWTDSAGDLIGSALPTSHYTINRTAATATVGEIVRVQLTMAGIDAAITANASGFGFTISAEYKGVPSTTPGAPAATVSNKMGSIMAAPNTITPPPIIDEIHVPTISITIKKVDEAGLALPGATFKIAKVGINPQPSDFVKGAGGVDLEGVTTIDANGDATLSFSNLPDYTNATGAKYYVIETEAPGGYNGGAVVMVEWANKATHQGLTPTDFHPVTGEWAENINLVKTISVKNTLLGTPNPQSPGFSLPLTGGAGTLLFTAIGIIVMLGAAGAYVYGKKRNIEE